MTTPSPTVSHLAADLFRHQVGSLVAHLGRRFGATHLELVEDVVQEALLRALRTWPFTGIPERPDAWLLQVATRLAIDHLRRPAASPLSAEPAKSSPIELETGPGFFDEIADDRLRMLFACCHSDLPTESQVALTLKCVMGFETSEIARAFLISEPSLAQRLVRARQRLRGSGARIVVPGPRDLPPRLDAVIQVIYLVFNEGYGPSGGDRWLRHDLALEALRLGELLADHPATATPAVFALCALMALQASRHDARTDGDGELILLEDQDRTRWDAALISRGLHHLRRAAHGDRVTRFHIEAAIASCHATAPSFARTDWSRVRAHYDDLVLIAPSPVVDLNRAVAVAMEEGPDAGLRELEGMAVHPGLERSHLFHATQGELLRRAGRRMEARAAFERALACPCSAPERRLLERRRESC
jgi:RNA polymerase sigma-70 factor (ECF subfamily)